MNLSRKAAGRALGAVLTASITVSMTACKPSDYRNKCNNWETNCCCLGEHPPTPVHTGGVGDVTTGSPCPASDAGLESGNGDYCKWDNNSPTGNSWQNPAG